MSKKITWRNFHKWVGLILTIFILIFCLSGVILNHRGIVAGCNISRNLLPSAYHIKQYNNGVIKGTLAISGDSIIAYGNAGAWLTDKDFSGFKDFNAGLPEGVDHRNIKNVIKTKDGSLWSAAQFGVYHHDGSQWVKADLPGNKERVSDITLNADSSRIVALTRSKVYTLPADGQGETAMTTVKAPDGVKPSVTLFKTVWMLHSGELFGLTGQIIVDIIAIIIIFLCLTGIAVFFLPYDIRHHHNDRPNKKEIKFLRWNLKWHNKVGYVTAILTIIIAATGMCLRPPLMIPLAISKTAPLPGSTLDSENYWQDKMRGIRWDEKNNQWLISTSEGFIRIDEDFAGSPKQLPATQTPPVSPMGITAFEAVNDGEWLIGSFSGLYVWNPSTGKVTDYHTGKDYNPAERSYGVGGHLVSGISRDLNASQLAVFDYSAGADSLPTMDNILSEQPMSLWNAALELHVGRCYAPFLGSFSALFVFLFGLLMVLILTSGLIIHTRNKKQTHNKQRNNLKQ